MNVYVPGGAGYIGSVLTSQLLHEGHFVHVLDNLMFGQRSPLTYIDHPRFTFEKGDFRNISSQREAIRRADVLIPMAGLVGAPICDRDPVTAEQTNVQAPLEFFKNVSKSQMILMPTTNSAYGHGEAGNLCDERSPLNPISTYAKMKVLVERELLSHPNSISFRLATVFGVSPRMRFDLLVNDFTHRAYRDRHLNIFEGHFKRCYIHIRDVARCFIHGISNFDRLSGNIFNVGLSSANISKLELARKIKDQIPDLLISEAEYAKDPDQRNYIVSNEKIERTGFSPIFTLEDGIAEVIKFLKAESPQVELLR